MESAERQLRRLRDEAQKRRNAEPGQLDAEKAEVLQEQTFLAARKQRLAALVGYPPANELYRQGPRESR